MKYRSGPARHAPEKHGAPATLAEGEFYFVVPPGNVLETGMWAVVPTTPETGPRRIRVSRDAEYAQRTPRVWHLAGELDAPTLTPSVRCDPGDRETWHGYLTSGEWEAYE